jgi:hypothetical protein
MWLQAAVRRAEAAVVSAIASGSLHSIIRAIIHLHRGDIPDRRRLISVSARRPLAATVARSSQIQGDAEHERRSAPIQNVPLSQSKLI